MRIQSALAMGGMILAMAAAPPMADYVPQGADAALRPGDEFVMRSLRAHEEASLSSPSWILAAGQEGSVLALEGNFYHVALGGDSSVYVYRTEMALRPQKKELPQGDDHRRAHALSALPADRPASGDTLRLRSAVLYKDSDLLAEHHLLPGSREWIVRQAENRMGFLRVEHDSLGSGWIYRSELPEDKRRPVGELKESRP